MKRTTYILVLLAVALIASCKTQKKQPQYTVLRPHARHIND